MSASEANGDPAILREVLARAVGLGADARHAHIPPEDAETRAGRSGALGAPPCPLAPPDNAAAELNSEETRETHARPWRTPPDPLHSAVARPTEEQRTVVFETAINWVGEHATTLIALWGAGTGTLALGKNWLDRRDAVRDRRRAAKAKQPWARLFSRGLHDDEWLVRIAFHNPTEDPLHITDVRLKRPWRSSIIIAHHRSEEAVELPLGSRSVKVNWMVYEPGQKGSLEPSGAEDISIRLPRGGWPFITRRPSSDKAQIEVAMLFKGETSPPMRDPVRIFVKAKMQP